MKLFRALAIWALVVLIPAAASAQALTSLQSLRVRYNSRKATVRPEGELKAQIDAVDRELAEASRLGKTGEVRRLLAKGTSLLAGRPWTDAADYAASLAIRSDRVVVDSSQPYEVRLEQIYSPSIKLERPLTAKVALRARPAGPAQAPSSPPALVKDLGVFDGVGRDLRDSPYPFALDVAGVADGTYLLAIEVLDGDASSARAVLTVSLRKGLNALVAKLEADAARAPEAVRADILYPVDRMRNVNRGRLELSTFDPDRDFPAAEDRGRGGAIRQERVRRKDRRLQAPLPTRLGRRDHALPDVRADGLQRIEALSANRRAPRPRRHRGFILRELRPDVPQARRTARLHRRRAARVSRRRLVRLGRRQPARGSRTHAACRSEASRTS